MSRLTYDAVIATRNRPEALALSLPLLLRQSRPPARLIIVDASDDNAETLRTIEAATSDWSGEVVIKYAPAGLPLQRNLGLAHVTAPIVLFPDDDSWLLPGAAEEILAVYERDADHQIAAVCAAEALSSPANVKDAASYKMSVHHKREARLRRFRNFLESRLTLLKPSLLLGNVLNSRHTVPEWCDGMNVVPVPYMTGFRMSFRTSAIRLTGFDEALVEYAVDEDIDASFSAMRSGLVVAAREARIYHHRCPGGRGNSFARGRMEVLNRAYVVLKHATGPLGSAALTNAIWRRHLMFTAVKLVLMSCKVWSSEGRRRFSGAMSGHRSARKLWHTQAKDRTNVCTSQTQPMT